MRHVAAVREIRAFNRFYTNIIGVIDRHILESKYSLTEVRVMYEIYHDRNATARKIKAFLQVDEGYLSHTLNKLAKGGLVRRTKVPGDHRAFIIALTKRGEEEFLLLNARSGVAVEQMIGTCSAGEVRELIVMMRRIQLLLRKEKPRRGPDRRN